jgi:hypothetical protein
MSATDATVTELTARTENVGLKLHIDNSSLALFDNLCTQIINCSGAVKTKQKRDA